MMRTYKFDDKILAPERFRFHVLRTLSVRKYHGPGLIQELIKKQKGICPICKGGRKLDSRAQVDHIVTVKEFANKLTLPLTKAYKQCRDLKNLRAVHPKCNNAQNRKAK